MPTHFSLANAMVGKPYQAQFQIASHSAGVTVVRCTFPEELGLAELGLHFDPATQTVSGTPRRAGEFRLSIAFRFAQDPRFTSELDHYECLLIVNPDPRSLWKNLPADATAPYARPDTEQGLVPAGAHRIAYASRRGRSHAHVGSYRDDAVWVHHEAASGWSVLAVADGAGSAKFSRQGAQLAVTVAGAAVATALAGTLGGRLDVLAQQQQHDPSAAKPLAETSYELLGRAAWAALKAIETEADSTQRERKGYATTLLLAVHKPTAQGHLVATFGVGDGAIALYREGQDIALMQQVDSGEYAGQTRFLDRTVLSDAQSILSRIQVRCVPDLSALLLMTDGVSDAHFNSDAELHSRTSWARLWQELAPLLQQEAPDAALQAWLDFWSPGNHDDRTLAVLW